MVLRLIGGPVPNPGWAGVLLLLFMAVGSFSRRFRSNVCVSGEPRLRERLAGCPLLVLAQAAALTGAGLLGWYAAQALSLLPDLDVDSQRSRMWLLIGHALAALVLIVSGLVAQRICRIDLPDPGGPGERAASAGGVAPA